MVGDYISTSFSEGKAFPFFVVAGAPSGGQLNEALSTVKAGLVVTGGTQAASDKHVVFTHPAPPALHSAF